MPRSGQLSTTIRVAMTARRSLDRESPATRMVEAQLARLLAEAGLDAGDDAPASCAGPGDVLLMLRHLGLTWRQLSPAARAAVREAERLCVGCPVTYQCARFFTGESRGQAEPIFCPNLALFRELREAAKRDPLPPGA